MLAPALLRCCCVHSTVSAFAFASVAQVVLLGQNVNSYNDLSEQTFPVSDPTQLLSKYAPISKYK